MTFDSDDETILGVGFNTTLENPELTLFEVNSKGVFEPLFSLGVPATLAAGLAYDPERGNLYLINGNQDDVVSLIDRGNETTTPFFTIDSSLNADERSLVVAPGSSNFRRDSNTTRILAKSRSLRKETTIILQLERTETVQFYYSIDEGPETEGEIFVEGVNDAPNATDDWFYVEENMMGARIGNVLSDGERKDWGPGQ